MLNNFQLPPYVEQLKSVCNSQDVFGSSEFWGKLAKVENVIGSETTQALVGVLVALHMNGDRAEIEREIVHWAYFPSRKNAKFFAKRIVRHGYRSLSSDPACDSKEILVRFSHFGAADLFSIAAHIACIQSLIPGTQGMYDGWETSVERDSTNPDCLDQSSKSLICA